MRQELIESQAENARLKQDNVQVQRELINLRNENNNKELKLTYHIENLKNQVSESSIQMSSLGQKLQESNRLKYNLERNNCELQQIIKDLEQNLETQKEDNDKVLKELAVSKEVCYNLNNNLRCKISELSQSRLSEERFGLELRKLKKEACNEAMKKDAARFCSIVNTFKIVLNKDETFCSSFNEAESLKNLSIDEICEMINFALVESIESKQIHFADLKNCITQMAALEERKNNHLLVIKELTLKIKAQNEILKKRNDEQDTLHKSNKKILIELNSKTNVLQNMQKKMEDFVKIIESFKGREAIAQKTISKYEHDIEIFFSKDLKDSHVIAQQQKLLDEKESTIINFKKDFENISKEEISKLKEDLIAKEKFIETSVNKLKHELLAKNLMYTALQRSKYKLDTDLERALSEKRENEDKVEQLKNELQSQENEYVSALVHHKDKFCVLENEVKSQI